MKSSFDHAVHEDLRRANEQTARRDAGSLTFRSVNAALSWFFEMRTKLNGPQSMTPKTHTTAGGAEVTISVDGGRGGDIAEVHTTMIDIDGGLLSLQKDYPRAFAIIVARLRDGQSWDALEKSTGFGRATLSAELGKAEAYLSGRWKSGGIGGAVLR